MQPLERSLRNILERTVKDARDTAESAAHAALDQLGVGEASPYPYMSESERELRRRLRAHGRQLGDVRNARTEVQEMDRLIEEVAYEHWHRMLFARFLAENNLLMYPDPVDPVAVTLEECEDLAADEGAASGWELASRYAARMLPQIFRPDSPVFQLTLPPEHQQRLERMVADLPEEVFTASDSLGWVYQFWQAKKRDEVNASEVKIGARELPAVTQLFTEPYMVSFLLDNSLGAWWAAGRLSETDLKHAESEEELRKQASLPGVPLDYLRFVKTEDGSWTPAGGTFDGWPELLSEFKTLDPCCGSGHFLVSALLMLVPMRMALEGLSAREAVDAVLRQNINGLEIDQRCVELAAFALALTAWRYPDAGGYRTLPDFNVACSGLSVSVAIEEWLKLANGDRGMRMALNLLHDEFTNAPVLGSLLNPAKTDAARIVQWDDLSKTLEKALSYEQTAEQREAAVSAQGLAKAARLLSEKYHLIITNVPYLARGKQNEQLRVFCDRNHPEAKNDLATVFLDRCLGFCSEGGTSSIVLPQNWLFLTSYRKFREKLLQNANWLIIARLGPGAFETVSGEVVKAVLLALSRDDVNALSGTFSSSGPNKHSIQGMDVSELITAPEKAHGLVTSKLINDKQEDQLKNPDARVILTKDFKSELLERYTRCLQGISPADAPRYGRNFWELISLAHDWSYWQSTAGETMHHGGKDLILWFGRDLEQAVAMGKAYVRGNDAWGKDGVVVCQMSDLPCTLYSGQKFDTNCAVIYPDNPSHLPAIWCFCSSPQYSNLVRQIDQSLKVTNATLLKVPFDLEHWTRVAEQEYPNGLPSPYSDDPTQWIFHGHPTVKGGVKVYRRGGAKVYHWTPACMYE